MFKAKENILVRRLMRSGLGFVNGGLLFSCVSHHAPEVMATPAEATAKAPYPPERLDPEFLQNSMVKMLHKGLLSAEKILDSSNRPLSAEL